MASPLQTKQGGRQPPNDRGEGNPTPRRRKTRRRRGPNAKVSKDAEAEATQPQRQGVERRGGGGNPTPMCRKTRRRREPSGEREGPGNPTRHKGPATTTGYWSRASGLCSGCYFFFFISLYSMYLHTKPRRGPSLVTIYLFTTIRV